MWVRRPIGSRMAKNEIRLMEAVLALAEELNFSRAAHRLGITQPALTKQISELEDRLGCLLFNRDRRKVSLSKAGSSFAAEARLSILHADRAVHAVRAAIQDAEIILNVGRSPSTDPFLISTLLSLRLSTYPRLKIEMHSRFAHELARDIAAGSLDLAFITEPPESPLLSKVKVAESPFYVAIMADDELSTLPSIRMDQLIRRHWVLFERTVHPSLYDRIMSLSEERNAAPIGIHHFMVAEEVYGLLAESNSVAFMTRAGALQIARTGVAIRPLQEDTLNLRTYLTSRGDNKSKLASRLVRAFMRKIETTSSCTPLNLAAAT